MSKVMEKRIGLCFIILVMITYVPKSIAKELLNDVNLMRDRESNGEPPNLAEWTLLDPLPDWFNIYGVAHGNERFVAVGSEGNIVLSVDGNTWNDGGRFTESDLRDVVFGQGTFVALVDVHGGENCIYNIILKGVG